MRINLEYADAAEHPNMYDCRGVLSLISELVWKWIIIDVVVFVRSADKACNGVPADLSYLCSRMYSSRLLHRPH